VLKAGQGSGWVAAALGCYEPHVGQHVVPAVPVWVICSAVVGTPGTETSPAQAEQNGARLAHRVGQGFAEGSPFPAEKVGTHWSCASKTLQQQGLRAWGKYQKPSWVIPGATGQP